MRQDRIYMLIQWIEYSHPENWYRTDNWFQPSYTELQEAGYNTVCYLAFRCRSALLGDVHVRGIDLGRTLDRQVVNKWKDGVLQYTMTIRRAAQEFLGLNDYYANKLFKPSPMRCPVGNRHFEPNLPMVISILHFFVEQGDFEWADLYNCDVGQRMLPIVEPFDLRFIDDIKRGIANGDIPYGDAPKTYRVSARG